MKWCSNCKGPKQFTQVRPKLPTPGHPGVSTEDRLLITGYRWWHCPSCAAKWRYNSFGQGEEEFDPYKLNGMGSEYDSRIRVYDVGVSEIKHGYMPI